jgi:hypothetical protein
MAANFPPTSLNLLTKLKAGGEDGMWQVSWKRFLELYHEPIEVIARSCYRHHTGGHEPSSGFIEDAVANTVADFFARGQHSYDKSKGRLRSYAPLELLEDDTVCEELNVDGRYRFVCYSLDELARQVRARLRLHNFQTTSRQTR